VLIGVDRNGATVFINIFAAEGVSARFKFGRNFGRKVERYGIVLDIGKVERMDRFGVTFGGEERKDDMVFGVVDDGFVFADKFYLPNYLERVANVPF